jgi:EAL domain-containing protein (putative c-di-GMP-specific phosphodiesterase class I)
MLDLAAFTLAPLAWPAQIAAILLAAAGGLALGRWIWPRPARSTRLPGLMASPARPAQAKSIGLAADRSDPRQHEIAAPVEVASASASPTVEDNAADLSFMGEMIGAIAAGAIDVDLQPKYDIRRGRVGGVEALVRWRHPARGLLGPDRFIPIAERTGHIRALSQHVLARAVEDQARLKRAGHELEVSVNISAGLLGDADFIEAALALAARAPGSVCFEITETAAGEAGEAACAAVARFAEAGVAIAIDDFGAGRCSLASLRRIAAHELKIDRSLVLDLADARRNTMLVRAAVEFGHSLGMRVTAEGVETNEAFALLAAMGCDFAQGFLIEQPMPVDDLLGFLAEDKAAARYG